MCVPIRRPTRCRWTGLIRAAAVAGGWAKPRHDPMHQNGGYPAGLAREPPLPPTIPAREGSCVSRFGVCLDAARRRLCAQRRLVGGVVGQRHGTTPCTRAAKPIRPAAAGGAPGLVEEASRHHHPPAAGAHAPERRHRSDRLRREVPRAWWRRRAAITSRLQQEPMHQNGGADPTGCGGRCPGLGGGGEPPSPSACNKKPVHQTGEADPTGRGWRCPGLGGGGEPPSPSACSRSPCTRTAKPIRRLLRDATRGGAAESGATTASRRRKSPCTNSAGSGQAWDGDRESRSFSAGDRRVVAACGIRPDSG